MTGALFFIWIELPASAKAERGRHEKRPEAWATDHRCVNRRIDDFRGAVPSTNARCKFRDFVAAGIGDWHQGSAALCNEGRRRQLARHQHRSVASDRGRITLTLPP